MERASNTLLRIFGFVAIVAFAYFLPGRRSSSYSASSNTIAGAKFEIGDVVRYQNRNEFGVIIGVDPICRKSKDWLDMELGLNNNVVLEQPFYTMLLESFDASTDMIVRYEPQSALKRAERPLALLHPDMLHRFTSFDKQQKKYIPK